MAYDHRTAKIILEKIDFFKGELSEDDIQVIERFSREENECSTIYYKFRELVSKFIINSETLFKSKTTLKEFLDLYQKIYRNEIFSPKYYALFSADEWVDDEIINIFINLTKKGIISFDSQNSDPNYGQRQRAYLSAICDFDIAKDIIDKINKIEGLIGYCHSIHLEDSKSIGPVMTYDDDIAYTINSVYDLSTELSRFLSDDITTKHQFVHLKLFDTRYTSKNDLFIKMNEIVNNLPDIE